MANMNKARQHRPTVSADGLSLSPEFAGPMERTVDIFPVAPGSGDHIMWRLSLQVCPESEYAQRIPNIFQPGRNKDENSVLEARISCSGGICGDDAEKYTICSTGRCDKPKTDAIHENYRPSARNHASCIAKPRYREILFTDRLDDKFLNGAP